ncbi:MAG: hypothetical protein L0I76_12940 [Pseudonocardia sp.]|nr:hypothetical protein [Pseudonocardia sp.]
MRNTSGPPTADSDLVERITGDERIVLLVIATGLPAAASSPAGQVIWLLTLLLGIVVLATQHRDGPDDAGPGHGGGGNGGGGGGLGRPTRPRPTTPAGTKQ